MFKILIVEDDVELGQLFRRVLEKNGYAVINACDGVDAMNKLETEYIDLIISDVMMPNMDGYEFVRELRDAKLDIPVLMITAKDRFQDMQAGFGAGTDDYMVKPVNVNEMVLRVGALLRRSKMISEKKLTVGGTVLEYDSLSVIKGGKSYVLPQKEFMLLYKLLSYPNHIYTRQQLMDDIWGLDTETESRTVDVHINRLRDRFRDSDDFEIVTVRGIGYKAVKKVEV
ncbi:MAG: response regulator transcription factor [Clostridiales bacterium]|nr:response regulator transcription factor [Clostridiales bacterium]